MNVAAAGVIVVIGLIVVELAVAEPVVGAASEMPGSTEASVATIGGESEQADAAKAITPSVARHRMRSVCDTAIAVTKFSRSGASGSSGASSSDNEP